MLTVLLRASILALLIMSGALAGPPPLLVRDARVFDGRADTLSGPMNVLVVEGRFARITADDVDAPDARIFDAGGRVLMPGLIDAHVHLMFSSLPPVALLTADPGYVNLVAGREAHDMLLRGFTSVRDMGGPTFGLKRAIDENLIVGPRIWPSGAAISQTGGHGDFRLPTEFPVPDGARPSHPERMGAFAIADSPDDVRRRVREQLALGASQIKLMAGGGVSSAYDPLDVTQFTVPELQAAVEAAENWGTYVTVHAYTPRAVRQAIEAGVRCVEHGHLLDEDTVRLMADKGVWWSLQPFVTEEGDARYPEGSDNRRKQIAVSEGTERSYRLAKEHGVRVAFGTDKLFDAARAARQNDDLVKVARFYESADVLRMATGDNGDLLALSGERSPYTGPVGVIEEGALADFLIVDADPLSDITLLADPTSHLVLIVKGGQVFKDTLGR